MVGEISYAPSGVRPEQLAQLRISEYASASPQSARSKASDELSLSPFTRSLLTSGLRSGSLGIVQGSIQFDLSYQASRTESANASGWYAREEKSLQMDLSFAISKTVVVNGVQQERSFQVRIHIAAKNVDEAALRPYQQSEDLVKFFRRIVDDIFAVSQDDTKFLRGIVFDLDDFAELAGMEKGKVLKLIGEFVQMVQYLARLRQMQKNDDGDDLESVILHPQRERHSGVEAEVRGERQLDIQISIQESSSISQETTSNADSAGKSSS